MFGKIISKLGFLAFLLILVLNMSSAFAQSEGFDPGPGAVEEDSKELTDYLGFVKLQWGDLSSVCEGIIIRDDNQSAFRAAFAKLDTKDLPEFTAFVMGQTGIACGIIKKEPKAFSTIKAISITVPGYFARRFGWNAAPAEIENYGWSDKSQLVIRPFALDEEKGKYLPVKSETKVQFETGGILNSRVQTLTLSEILTVVLNGWKAEHEDGANLPVFVD